MRFSHARLIRLMALLLFLSGTSSLFAIPLEIENALKLNRINHYDEALDLVEKALREDRIKPDITSAYTIGRILYRKGELYREMADISVLTTIGYLNQVQGAGELRDELKVFLGMALFFDGRYAEAEQYLARVVERRRLKGTLASLALVYLGASRHAGGDKSGGREAWERVDESEPLALSTLGFMYAYLNINPSMGEDLTRRAADMADALDIPDAHRSSIRMHHAYTLLQLGQFHEAYNDVNDTYLDKPIFILRPDPRTEIRFYDLSVLYGYSRILFGESIKNLEPIVTASSGELASFASYYVAQMYLYLGKSSDALDYAAKAQKLSVASSLTMMRAVACEASALILSGREKKGKRILNNEIEGVYGKPSVLLEMLKVMSDSGVDYAVVDDVVSTIRSYIFDTSWNRTRRDFALLGELAFFSNDENGAVFYLERARDKGNKNRIETNDPGFLLKLSYVYYRRELFSESLEILFSLGENFNGVRPLQDAVQSVYSYKQRGSGEAYIE
jgi:tetratricopeptide (TPR) repeat protein